MNLFKCAAAAAATAVVLFGSAETAQGQRRLGGLAAMGAGLALLANSSHDVCMTSGEMRRTFYGDAYRVGSVTLEHVFDEIECTADEITASAPGLGSDTATRAAVRAEFVGVSRSVFAEEIAFIDGFTAELEAETRPAFLYGGLGAVAAGALAAFWPSAPVDVWPDVRNNGLRVSRTFGW